MDCLFCRHPGRCITGYSIRAARNGVGYCSYAAYPAFQGTTT